MKRTTIFAEESLLDEIRTLSKEEGRSVAEIVREAMEHYIQQKKRRHLVVSFIAVGASGKNDIADRHEELLWQEPTR